MRFTIPAFLGSILRLSLLLDLAAMDSSQEANPLQSRRTLSTLGRSDFFFSDLCLLYEYPLPKFRVLRKCLPLKLKVDFPTLKEIEFGSIPPDLLEKFNQELLPLVLLLYLKPILCRILRMSLGECVHPL